jgi:hypothetical protein
MKTIGKLIFPIIMAFTVISCTSSKELVVKNLPDRPAYRRQPAPGDDFVWTEGDWVVHHGAYKWKKGEWVKARFREWIDGDWEKTAEGWKWKKGHWDLPSYVVNRQEIIFQ